MTFGHLFTNCSRMDLGLQKSLLTNSKAQKVSSNLTGVKSTRKDYPSTQSRNVTNAVKEPFYEDRLVFYDYPPVIEELLQLEKNEKNGRIDHPPRGCFVGETRVPLLDGTCPTIAELAGKENMWVYSARPDGSIVPGKAKGFLSKYATELVDVAFDNGVVIRCRNTVDASQWTI